MSIPMEDEQAENFYPRPLRGGRRISLLTALPPVLFLSTPSARRATKPDHLLGQLQPISIHALCEEGDHSWHRQPHTPRYFYPRPLRGGRPDG